MIWIEMKPCRSPTTIHSRTNHSPDGSHKELRANPRTRAWNSNVISRLRNLFVRSIVLAESGISRIFARVCDASMKLSRSRDTLSSVYVNVVAEPHLVFASFVCLSTLLKKTSATASSRSNCPVGGQSFRPWAALSLQSMFIFAKPSSIFSASFSSRQNSASSSFAGVGGW